MNFNKGVCSFGDRVLWALKVLDAHAEEHGTLTPSPRKVPKRLGGGYVVFTGRGCVGYRGTTRDEARIAAADALVLRDGKWRNG